MPEAKRSSARTPVALSSWPNGEPSIPGTVVPQSLQLPIGRRRAGSVRREKSGSSWMIGMMDKPRDSGMPEMLLKKMWVMTAVFVLGVTTIIVRVACATECVGGTGEKPCPAENAIRRGWRAGYPPDEAFHRTGDRGILQRRRRHPCCGREIRTNRMGVRRGVMRSLLLWCIRFYQRFLSPWKGFRCAYGAHTGRSSCSAFGYHAVERHGVLVGWSLLRRRLRRCATSCADRHQGAAPNGTGRIAAMRRLQSGHCDLPIDACPVDLPHLHVDDICCNTCASTIDLPCDVWDWRRRRNRERSTPGGRKGRRSTPPHEGT